MFTVLLGFVIRWEIGWIWVRRGVAGGGAEDGTGELAVPGDSMGGAKGHGTVRGRGPGAFE